MSETFEPDPLPLEVEELPAWAMIQFQRLAQMIQNPTVELLNAAPAVPVEGKLVIADGTNWNPGAGRGLYFWTGAAWEKL